MVKTDMQAPIHGYAGSKGTDKFLAPSPSGCYANHPMQRIVENRFNLFRSVELHLDNTVWLAQMHENQIHIVGEAHRGQDARCQSGSMIGDAMVTDTPGLVLVGKSADCPVIKLWSTAANVVAIVHAGRAGIKDHLLGRVIRTMTDEFGVSLDSICGHFDPMISTEHYQFNDKRDAQEVAWFQVRHAVKRIDGQPHLDMKQVLLGQVNMTGANLGNFTWDSRCTWVNSELHSHRRTTVEEDNGFDRDNNLSWIQCAV